MTLGDYSNSIPVLYSFRRCPYAIRARLALFLAGIEFELREVNLKSKPQALLDISPKATVPVLVLPSGEVLDESYDIVLWAFAQSYPANFTHISDSKNLRAESLYQGLHENFIPHLNKYKYPDRYSSVDVKHEYNKIVEFLNMIELDLEKQAFLCGSQPYYIDILFYPFLRQLHRADENIIFNMQLNKVERWLLWWENHALMPTVMRKAEAWCA